MSEQEIKIVVINPFDEDASLEDGHTTYIRGGEYFCHSDLLTEYGLQVYGENSIFDILSKGNYLPDVPVYFLVQENNNVVFLNVSSKKYGKRGLLFMPANPSFEQEDSLYNFLEGLDSFSITVNSNMRIEDGIVYYDSDAMFNMAYDDEKRKTRKKA